MKRILTLFVLLSSLSFYAQNEIKITPKKCLPKKGIHLRLKNVFDDSRCPEGVTCIWAGEVSVTIEVYNNKKFVEEKAMVFNTKNRDENLKWFEKYYQKKIKSIGVFPHPKDRVTIQPKKQFVKIIFEN
jgi:hypothetical protein